MGCKVVAIDTPENLTHQLKGAGMLYVQVAGSQDATACCPLPASAG
jgi:hypothetical protein